MGAQLSQETERGTRDSVRAGEVPARRETAWFETRSQQQPWERRQGLEGGLRSQAAGGRGWRCPPPRSRSRVAS